MNTRFDTGLNPVGSFHTHLYNNMPSTIDINNLIEDTKEDINAGRIFSHYIMSIGGVPKRNIKCYLPKFLYGIRSPDECLLELNNLSRKVNCAHHLLKPYMREGNEKNFAWMNDYYMSPIINEYFDTKLIFLLD